MRAPFVLLQGLRALVELERRQTEVPVDDHKLMSDIRILGLDDQKALPT